MTRTRTARNILKVLDEGSNENPIVEDHLMTSDELELVIQDMQDSLDNRLKILATKATQAKSSQKQHFFKTFVQVHKAIKKMTVAEFNETHGCDLLVLLTENSSKSPSGKKRLRANQAVNEDKLKTPAPAAARNQAPATVRTVKRGERIFSENGSPVDTFDEGALVATVTKKRRRSMGISASSAVFDISVGGGRTINLNNPESMKHLNDDLKSDAINQLQVLQNQMASLMAQLKN
mmetsp:Transcript_3132/g.4749  ORF Transcript_3132/g.4749 Transcript_3132/m.4749 type:complete len:235 (+) Transcript_3132:120-824(+)